MIDGDLTVEHTPGDHVSMVRGENLRILAATLERALRVSQREDAASPAPTVALASDQAARATGS